MSRAEQLVGTIVVSPFVLNSADCNAYVLYLIAVDLARRRPDFALPLDARYSEISRLELVIHDGPYVALEYRVTRGRGYRLPRIVSSLTA